MRHSNYEDIYRLHEKHRLPIGTVPTLMTGAAQLFRSNFLREELLEFEAALKNNELGEAADALVDLVVVAMGTAVMMGLPWQVLWNDVHRANMSKERVTSDRAQGDFDLMKPAGWQSPNSQEIVDLFIENGVHAPVYSESPKVVTLCGSTKFKEQYTFWNRHLTLAGYVVLSVGFFSHADEEEITATTKAELDQLHLHKIRSSDEVFVLNVGGYIGSSTRDEINYAESIGVPVKYLEVT